MPDPSELAHQSNRNVEGVVLSAQAIGPEGEYTSFERFAVELHDDQIDVRRLGQRKDVIWTIDLASVEEAVRFLKRERRTSG